MRGTEYIEVFCPSQGKSQNGLWCPAAQEKLQTNTLQALPSGSSGASALSSPAGRNASDSRSPIASELAEGPRTDL